MTQAELIDLADRLEGGDGMLTGLDLKVEVRLIRAWAKIQRMVDIATHEKKPMAILFGHKDDGLPNDALQEIEALESLEVEL